MRRGRAWNKAALQATSAAAPAIGASDLGGVTSLVDMKLSQEWIVTMVGITELGIDGDQSLGMRCVRGGV
ncbi:hypothetical protein [Caulobacter sp. 602-1]|uniref:hypothetical protein n=1 Tax=Caulobacter sp. 602-1 TaxID=2492472 RepID=UPI00131563B8|nr:hypothetical protein [Caulobacter sp. 602-1]